MIKTKLKDIAVSQTGPFGSQLHESDYVVNGTPIVTVEHLGETGFSYQNLPLVSDQDKTRLSKYLLKEGDIVFSRVGSVDRNTYVSKSEDGWLFSGRCIRVRVDKIKADPKFISFYFRQKTFKEMMLNISVGATMPSLNTTLMNNIPLNLPDLKTQQKIASILSAIDDKIELNNKINAELEGMAKLIYDYWFVQFDFPYDFAQGKPADESSDHKDVKPYKSSGGKMVWNGELKREIPEGWGSKNLFACCKVQYGFPFSTDYFNEVNGIPVIRIRDILENSISNYSSEKDIDPKYKIEVGDLLIGMDGNFHLNYWSIPDCFLNQRVVKLTKTILPNIYLKQQIEPFIKLREKSVSRTTVGHLSDKDLKSIFILIPPNSILKNTLQIFDNSLDKILENRNQNHELSALRDWLLPMLMNGQVRVEGKYKVVDGEIGMAAEAGDRYGESKLKSV